MPVCKRRRNRLTTSYEDVKQNIFCDSRSSVGYYFSSISLTRASILYHYEIFAVSASVCQQCVVGGVEVSCEPLERSCVTLHREYGLRVVAVIVQIHGMYSGL